jgi:hypothetical protein
LIRDSLKYFSQVRREKRLVIPSSRSFEGVNVAGRHGQLSGFYKYSRYGHPTQ